MRKEVLAGFFSFTEVTDPKEHFAYNEWHQLDHLPEQIPLEGIVFGQRWVRSPECRMAQLGAADLLDPVHYMTLYLMTGPILETLEDFKDLGRELREVGRFHEHRNARLSGPFETVDSRAAPRVLVSPDAIPYRPNLGVYVIVERTSSREPFPAVDNVLSVPGVAGVWTFVGSDALAGERWSPGPHRVSVAYLDDEPCKTAESLNPVVEQGLKAGAPSELELAGPFETITPWKWDWFERP
ncbi:MAG TPA: hypothetical protein VEJ87_05735 [Acidimicrobiales bacterium]|nr:hypothetical protein [Acidimicrobiales bacterium]